MNKKTIEDIQVQGKKVLVRCDFNVPLDKEGNITDENRIVGAMPTIKYLADNGAKVILCSHMGKPHNVFNETIKLNKKEKAKIEALPEEENRQLFAALRYDLEVNGSHVSECELDIEVKECAAG